MLIMCREKCTEILKNTQELTEHESPAFEITLLHLYHGLLMSEAKSAILRALRARVAVILTSSRCACGLPLSRRGSGIREMSPVVQRDGEFKLFDSTNMKETHT